VTRDLTRGTVEVELATNNGTRLADGTLYQSRGHATTSVNESNPADASIVGTSSLALESARGTVEARARGEIRSDASTLHVTVNLDVLVDGATFHSRRWSRSVPRRLL
jgi:hypothetical protein